MASTTMSTYSSYLVVNRDIKSSLTRVANQSTVARDTAYYQENIGKVTTVDEFVDDYQMFSYAMKAYGLEEMTYAKAFMKKVLESDLSDDSSFANTLTDKRYANFAAAFNFSGGTEVAQTSTQTGSLTDAYEASFAAEETNIKTEVDYYTSAIGSVTSVDDLLNNTRLRTFVLEAFDIDPVYTSKSYLKSVLTSDVDDASSFVNQNGNSNFKALAAAFNFNNDGTISGDSAQTTDQIEDVQLSYVYNKSTYPSDLLQESNQRYWEKNLATITTADELVADGRMLEYVKTAFGIRESMMASSVASILKSDLNNPNSPAAIMGYENVTALFNFQTNGTIAEGDTAQDTEQAAETKASYAKAFSADQADAVENAISNFETRIATVASIDDFLVSNDDDDDDTNDDVTEIWDVALRAFGINPDEISNSELRKILSSDLTDKSSYANQLDDERFTNLVSAFNFDASGNTEAPLLAQSENTTSNYTSAYESEKIRYLTGAEKTEALEDSDAEIEYFKTQMETIKTRDELLADDRLTTFILEAQGIDPESVTSDELRQMFESDLTDPNSYVNSLSDNTFAEIVASFNFDIDGNLTTETMGTIQQRGDVLETINNYYQQTLEEDQGNSNAGVRLALYFERTAPTISSAYGLLGDDALFQFITTTFSLSDYVSSMDVEKQASMIESYIDLEKLQDPDYVQDLVKRFTALYDLENNTATSGALSILSGTNSISADTLLAVAQLSSQ